MPAVTRYSDAEITERLATLPGWRLKDGKLQKQWKFKDFAQAFGFMASVALVAEGMDHHPDWSNSYNRVTINLMTHSVGGISQRDFDLARKIDQLPASACGRVEAGARPQA